ncbi:MAG: FGGY-family carbohydrate kinase, partial [Actinomycetota bacterium]|nr:FGGY-family carbohydrate kinase [Actinomycetota bacterium]
APVLEAPDLGPSLDRREDPALPEGDPGAVWATLLDALARFTADAVQRVAEVVGQAERLVVFGGGALSEPWLAAKARHLPMSVWRSPASEAVARGAAVFAGLAAGWWATPEEAPRPKLEPC